MVFTPEKKRTAPDRKWANGRTAFRAHAAAILVEIDERERPLRSVWEEFRARLGGLGYVQFTRYVQRARKRAMRGEAPPPPKAPPQQPARDSTPRGAGEASEPRPTFHFDPMDAYRKKFV